MPSEKKIKEIIYMFEERLKDKDVQIEYWKKRAFDCESRIKK